MQDKIEKIEGENLPQSVKSSILQIYAYYKNYVTVKDLDESVKQKIEEIFKDDFAKEEELEESESDDSAESPGKMIQLKKKMSLNYEAIDNIYKANRDVKRTQVLRDMSKKNNAKQSMQTIITGQNSSMASQLFLQRMEADNDALDPEKRKRDAY